MEKAALGVQSSQAFGEGQLVLAVLLRRSIKLFHSKSDGCLIGMHPDHPVDQLQIGGHLPRVTPTPSRHDGHHL